MEFVAIDVETANADMASICQIGLAKFRDYQLICEWSSLINPEDYFDFINTNIHGITEEDITDYPTFPEVVTNVSSFLSGKVCVSHTHFDRVSIRRALKKYSLNPIEIIWLDSAKVARRTWEECARRGYVLSNVCKIIGYKFKHHDALEDAKESGQIVIAAAGKTGLSINDWLKRVNQPINPVNSSKRREKFKKYSRDGNPEWFLYGEILVFTGTLKIPRRDAADLAASVGCTVASSITKKTSLLVVGDQNVTKLYGKVRSSKHLKAEKLIAKGQKIRIVKESDFQEFVNQAHMI